MPNQNLTKQRRIGGAAGTFFSPEQIATLLTAARAHSERDWLLILVTVNHGLRASEAVGLVAGDVREGSLWITRLKGSKRTVQPLTSEEREPLLRLCQGKAAGDRLFPISRMQFWRIMRASCRRAGLDMISAHPHSLKHSMCRAVLAETGSLVVTAKRAGHARITSTQVYTAPTDQQAAAAAAGALTWNTATMTTTAGGNQ